MITLTARRRLVWIAARKAGRANRRVPTADRAAPLTISQAGMSRLSDWEDGSTLLPFDPMVGDRIPFRLSRFVRRSGARPGRNDKPTAPGAPRSGAARHLYYLPDCPPPYPWRHRDPSDPDLSHPAP